MDYSNLDLDTLSGGDLPDLDVTNGLIRHLFELVKGDDKLGDLDVLKWLKLFCVKKQLIWDDDERVLKKIRSIKLWKNLKKTSAHKKQFLETVFTLPVPHKRKDDDSSKRKQKSLDVLTRAKKSKIDVQELSVAAKLVKTRYMVKHVNYAYKMKNKQIRDLRSEFRNLRNDIERLKVSQAQESYANLLNKYRKVLSQKRSLKHYYKNEKPLKMATMATQTETKIVDDSNSKRIQELENENQCLKERLVELEIEKNKLYLIKAKSDGRTYSNDVRKAVCSLASKRVSVEQIGPVIQCVLGGIADSALDFIPDSSTCSRIVKEMQNILR